MSGELVGLVRRHGPRDLHQFVVLMIVAEEQRGPFRHTEPLTDDELVRRTRLGRTSVKAAVKGLYAGRWLGGRRGTSRGIASRYCLALDKYPEDEVAAIVHRATKGSPRDPYEVLDLDEKGSPRDPYEVDRGRHANTKGSPRDPLSRIRTNSVPESPPEPSPGLPDSGAANDERDTDFQTAILVDASTPVADAKALVDKLREQAAAGKTNGRASGAAPTNGMQRVAAGADRYDTAFERRRR